MNIYCTLGTNSLTPFQSNNYELVIYKIIINNELCKFFKRNMIHGLKLDMDYNVGYCIFDVKKQIYLYND